MNLIKKKQIDMTEGNIASQIIAFAIPILLGDLLQQFYNVADSLIVGNFVSKQGLAAVGATSNIINVLVGFFSGISIGATVAVSKYFGAKRRERLETTVRTTMWLTFGIGVLFTFLGMVMTGPMLKLLKTPDDVLSDAKLYLLIYFAGISGQVIYNMCAGILRAVGDSTRPMIALGLTSVLNIGMDLVFIIVFKWGVAGAALATIISQFISAGVLFRWLYTIPDIKPFSLGKPSLDPDIMREIFIVGLPVGIRKSVISFSNTIVVSFVNNFGSSAMAAWSVNNKVDNVINIMVQSLSTATSTFVAQNVGAKKYDRIKKGTRTALLMSLGSSAFFICLFVLFRTQIVSLFNRDEEVIYYGSLIFLNFMPFQMINPFTQTMCGVMQGKGDTKGTMVIFITCYVVLRQLYLHIGWNFFKSFLFVVYSFPVMWFVCAMLTFVYYKHVERKFQNAQNCD